MPLCRHQALNYLANKKDLPYDKDGNIARSGTIDNQLLTTLNSHPFYSQNYPKSLGREFFEENIKPLLENRNDIANLMATFVEHIAMQIANSTNNCDVKTRFIASQMLITGGGAKNKYLV